MHDERKLELKEDERGDVLVHVGSAGDMVGNFAIALIDEKAMKPFETRKTNEHGLVTFRGVPPGRYTAIIRMSREKRLKTSAGITDVELGVNDDDLMGTPIKKRVPKEDKGSNTAGALKAEGEKGSKQ